MIDKHADTEALTNRTLLEQMGLNEFEIEHRKRLFGFDDSDAEALLRCKEFITGRLESLVKEFHSFQTQIPEVVQLIGDADTLKRLSISQSCYILQLFNGEYALEYVNDRLRIGMVHKRIGVEPKLYFSTMLELKKMLFKALHNYLGPIDEYDRVTSALEKLLMFDNTLVFDTYIHALVAEVQIARYRAEEYSRELELKVHERTRQLEEQSRTDPLTGLLNVRFLQSTMKQVLKAAQRRQEPICFIYMDIDDFKPINDNQGHQAGDEVLKGVAQIILESCREEDKSFRYGGDEFCLLLPNCDADHAKSAVCQRINKAIKARWQNLHISMGLVESRAPEYLSAENMINKADAAMYANKKRHKASQKAKKADEANVLTLKKEHKKAR